MANILSSMLKLFKPVRRLCCGLQLFYPSCKIPFHLM